MASHILDCTCSTAYTAACATQDGILGTQVLPKRAWPGCFTRGFVEENGENEISVTLALLLDDVLPYLPQQKALHLKRVWAAACTLLSAFQSSIRTTVVSLFRNTGVIQLILWDYLLPYIRAGICGSLPNWVLSCFQFTEREEERDPPESCLEKLSSHFPYLLHARGDVPVPFTAQGCH